MVIKTSVDGERAEGFFFFEFVKYWWIVERIEESFLRDVISTIIGFKLTSLLKNSGIEQIIKFFLGVVTIFFFWQLNGSIV